LGRLDEAHHITDSPPVAPKSHADFAVASNPNRFLVVEPDLVTSELRLIQLRQ
jgi:hypothetical protein